MPGVNLLATDNDMSVWITSKGDDELVYAEGECGGLAANRRRPDIGAAADYAARLQKNGKAVCLHRKIGPNHYQYVLQRTVR